MIGHDLFLSIFNFVEKASLLSTLRMAAVSLRKGNSKVVRVEDLTFVQ